MKYTGAYIKGNNGSLRAVEVTKYYNLPKMKVGTDKNSWRTEQRLIELKREAKRKGCHTYIISLQIPICLVTKCIQGILREAKQKRTAWSLKKMSRISAAPHCQGERGRILNFTKL